MYAQLLISALSSLSLKIGLVEFIAHQKDLEYTSSLRHN